MAKRIKVLLVEDYKVDQMAFKRFVKRKKLPYDHKIAGSVAEARKALEAGQFDVVLTDYKLGDGTAFDLFDDVGNTPFIVITGTGSEEIAVEAMRAGATHYLIKDPNDSYLTTLAITVEEAIDRKRNAEELTRYRERLEELVEERTAELAKANEQLKAEIIERKRVGEVLRESEERYRTILASIEDSYYETDLEGNYTFFNDAMCRLIGYSRDEMMGMNNREYMDAENAKKVFQTFNEVYKTGKPAKGSGWEGITKDGIMVSVEASISLMKDPEGKPIGFRGIIRDITERKQAENELRRLKSFNEGIIQSMLEWVIVMDIEGIITFINSAASVRLGYSPEEIIGQHWRAIVPPDQHEIVDGAEDRRARGDNDHYGLILISKDGTRIPVLVGSGQRYEEGQIVGDMAVFTDISESKLAEELQNAIYRIAQAADRSPNLENLFQAIHEIIQSVMPAGNFYIALYDEEEDFLSFPYFVDEVDVPSPPQKLGRGLTEYVLSTGETLLCDTSCHDELERLGKADLVGEASPIWLGVPLIIEGKTIGVMAVQHYTDPEAYGEREQNILEFVSSQVARAIDKKQAEGEIRYHASLFENVSDAIVSMDMEFVIQSWNEAAERMYGWKEHETIGKPMAEVFKPEYPYDTRDDVVQKLMETGQYKGEVIHYRKDGTPMNVVGSVSMLKNEEGNPVGSVSVIRDITERKRVEDALKESEARYMDLYENAPDMYMSVDAKTALIIQCNQTVIDNLGYVKEELIGHPLSELYDPDCIEEVKKTFKRFVEMGEVRDQELQVRRKDGSNLDVSLNVSAVRDKDGSVLQSRSTWRDITKRKLAEEALQKHAHDLGERVKELDCLMSISKLMETADIPLQEIFQGTVGFIPPAWQYPEVTCGRIFINNQPYTTQNYEESKWKMTSEILVHGEREGIVEALYLEERPESDEGPFLREERDLMDAIAERLGNAIERKRGEEQIQLQLQRISGLHDIDLAITASLDLRLTLNVLLNQVSNQLKVDATAVFLMDPSQFLIFETGQGFRNLDLIRSARIRIGDRLAGQAALERKIIIVPDLREIEATSGLAKVISKEGFVAYYGVPLVAKGELVGVLEIYHRSPLEPDSEWLDFLKTLAGQAAIAISNAVLFDDLQRTKIGLEVSYAKTLEGWVRALDMRDKETEGHTQRVTELTIRLASFMGIEKDELVHISRGALLHDIGKMAVPDEILHKKESLTDEEWEVIHQHPIYARDFLAEIDYLKPAIDIPYCHHEKWDGSGYPLGLRDREIPLTARIFAVVDVWDALRSDRPYRKAWPRKKTLKHIQEQSGKHFDPQVVEAFVELIEEE